MLKIIQLAIRSLWREWRAGEWLIACFALLLAVTATTSMHFYTDRLLRGLDKQSATFLGGDLVVSSSTPIPADWVGKTQQLKLRTAQVWSYLTVINSKNQASSNQMQLVSLRAVSEDYPLIGDSSVYPDPRTMWIEPRLLPLLSILIGDKVKIGSETFTIKRILSSDIDTLGTGLIIAPRVLIRLDDVPATHTVLPGSRVDYRLLVAGNTSDLQAFKNWITPLLQPGQTLIDVHSQHFALQDIVQRTEYYLQLILLVCLLMSGVAISLSIQQYIRRHYAQIALWRCLGARQNHIVIIFFIQLVVIAFTIGVIGIFLGYVAQEVFAYIFEDFIRFPLPASGLSPIILGFFTSNLILFLFSFPLVSELPRISPLYIWRDEVSMNTLRGYASLAISFLIILLFVSWFMNFSLLSIFFFLGLFISVIFLYGISLLFIYALRIAVKYMDGTFRRGISQLIQHPNSISLQFIGFNLILIAIIVSGLIRGNLIDSWQQSLPVTAPNFFAFNIDRSDIVNLENFFQKQNIRIEGIYPMVRGRLTALNGKPILTAVPVEAINNNALHRDLNLSWMWELPSDNKIVKGEPWTLKAMNKPLVSVEYKLAQDLRLHLGDELTFQIGEQKFNAIITNFRTLVWSSIHPNFFMIFPPGLLNNFPSTYITSFHLDAGQQLVLNDLVKIFPNVTIVDMANVLLQIQDLLSKMIIAMQYLFVFAAGLGILIFIACLQATMDERRQTYSLLHVLGADKQYISRSLMVEFFTLFFLIVFTAILFSVLIGNLLVKYIFNL